MRKLLSIFALMLACTVPAVADPPTPTYTVINAVTTTIIPARVFYGVGSVATQITVVSCFDNNALSGTQIYSGTPTAASNLTASLPASGVNLTSGFVTCAIATSVVAPGYTVFWSR